MKRSASAVWNGSGKEGHGTLTTQSKVLSEKAYSFSSRFEEVEGTNPEELVAAAHAGCFSMKLSFVLGAAGFTPKKLETKCVITFEDGAIVNSHLVLKAIVDGIDDDAFAKHVQEAEENCPISKLLNTKITSEFTLNK